MTWWMWILKIVLGIILAIVIAVAGLFGYIAWKARARKWSGGMFLIVIVAIVLLYRFILANPWNLIPF